MPSKRGHNQISTVGPGDYDYLRRSSGSPEAHRKRAIYEALAQLGEVVYVIRCPDGLIKIGWTHCLRVRRCAFDADFEDILAVIPGSYPDEQAIHQRFREHCVKGREYYRPAQEILDFINEIRARAGVPELAA